MRSTRATVSVVVFTLIALLAAALPAFAQDEEQAYEVYERPAPQEPVEGFARSDGTLILKDEGFCSYLLGAIWGDEKLTFSRLIDRSKKQKKARKNAFLPASDAGVLQRCSDVLNAFRLDAPDEDPLAVWARSGPVVPEALADLLPADLLNSPLAEPQAIGDGSRTSGFGDLFSAPFALTGGTYFVQVDDRACSSWAGSLKGARDPSLEQPPIDGQAYLYDVAPASYYWDISAPGCDWSVDLVAVELGPEPTATPTPRAVVPRLFGYGWVSNPAVKNHQYLTAARARATLLEAGLAVGACNVETQPPISADRVWKQDPLAGTLLEFGSAVDVWIGGDCDILHGDRIIVE